MSTPPSHNDLPDMVGRLTRSVVPIMDITSPWSNLLVDGSCVMMRISNLLTKKISTDTLAITPLELDTSSFTKLSISISRI